MSAAVHALTPVVGAIDPRGLVLRTVDYCRAGANEVAERRVRCSRFDALGRVTEQWDPRLWALHEANPTTPANLALIHSLSGAELSRTSVDSGFACALFGEAGQVVYAEDGRGTRRELEYDALVRPLAIFEQEAGQARVCSERFIHGGAEAPDNGCGRVLRHDDPAGTRFFGYALDGTPRSESRRFLADDGWPDWPSSSEERDALLEPLAALTTWRRGPLGEALEQVDAAGNRQSLGLDVAGQLRSVGVRLGEGAERMVLQDARYDAFARVEQEQLGNGVRLQRTYGVQDGRLLSLQARRASGEVLQDLHYTYDPAGNAVLIEDLARPARHFANQRIEARCEYVYDSLYQLREASGWEAGAVGRGPGLVLDPAAISNYRQTYAYDAAGNLLELVHAGAQAHGHTLVAAQHSNRCLPVGEDFNDAFDANGNLRRLQPGQALDWNRRNELCQVNPLSRDNAADDREHYVYDGDGQRVRKVRFSQAARRVLAAEVRYLPGLERHCDDARGECLDIVLVQAGSCGVRLLHWQAGRPDEVSQDQVRYGLCDHLGSSTLELDADAALISHEVFHPFGTTAWWAARNAIEASYKTVRYSGKERDASGLYYYGARYYRADWQRWLNPDPAGEVDGLNLYCMVGNAPVNRRDADGRQGEDQLDDVERDMVAAGDTIRAIGLDNFTREQRNAVRNAAKEGRRWARAVRDGIGAAEPDSTYQAAMRSAFGKESLGNGQAEVRLRADLGQTMRDVGHYLHRLGNKEGWRLILAELNDPDELAATLTSRGERHGGRIALSSRIVAADKVDLASILFHEALHAMNRHREHVLGEEDVLDYWDDFPELGSMGTPSERETELHARLALRVREGPSESTMPKKFKPWYKSLINKGAAELGLKRAEGRGQRNRYFRQHPAIRYKVMLRNANTLADFASAFHRPRST